MGTSVDGYLYMKSGKKKKEKQKAGMFLGYVSLQNWSCGMEI